jgi:hypothetical protein
MVEGSTVYIVEDWSAVHITNVEKRLVSVHLRFRTGNASLRWKDKFGLGIVASKGFLFVGGVLMAIVSMSVALKSFPKPPPFTLSIARRGVSRFSRALGRGRIRSRSYPTGR